MTKEELFSLLDKLANKLQLAGTELTTNLVAYVRVDNLATLIGAASISVASLLLATLCWKHAIKELAHMKERQRQRNYDDADMAVPFIVGVMVFIPVALVSFCTVIAHIARVIEPLGYIIAVAAGVPQ